MQWRAVFDRALQFLFNLTEKVLLPHLLRKSEQLHLVTGQKFDIFGVMVSNVNKCNVFNLPDGYWSGEKLLIKCVLCFTTPFKTRKISWRPSFVVAPSRR